MITLKRWRGVVLGLGFAWTTSSLAGVVVTRLAFSPDPPEPGPESVSLTISDESGKPIEKAKVDIRVGMPAMGTMPEMHMDATLADAGGGSYKGEVELSMGGTWEVILKVTPVSGAASTHLFGITTGIPGVTPRGGGASVAAGDSKEAATPVLEIGPERIQRAGVRFAEAKALPMKKILRTAGVVETDSSRRAEVTLRYSAVVVEVRRGRAGESVREGDVLARVDSPEWGASHAGDSKSGGVLDVVAPQAGILLEANLVQGGRVEPGQVLAVIGDPRRTYVTARVYQQDIRDTRVGQTVEVVAPGAPTGVVHGRVDSVSGVASGNTGTSDVRVEITDPDPGLRFGQFVEARFDVDLGTHLAIPAESVLHSGARQYVFVDKGAGRLEPREVVTGRLAEDLVEVVSGLAAGDRVVASGNFLIDSEAKLRGALPKWTTP